MGRPKLPELEPAPTPSEAIGVVLECLRAALTTAVKINARLEKGGRLYGLEKTLQQELRAAARYSKYIF